MVRGAEALSVQLRGQLKTWQPRIGEQERLRDEYRVFLAEARAGAVDRTLGRSHVTGSAFVFTPALAEVLLCLHRKAGCWLQLGGHVEARDASVLDTAVREAREEAGIADLRPISSAPLDLDRHDLGAGFVRCDTHWDIGYGFTATGEPLVSDESEAVRWWSVDDLPRAIPPGFELRLRRLVERARALASNR